LQEIEMLAFNEYWIALKRRLFWSAAARFLVALAVSVALPIMEGLLINLYTSAPEGTKPLFWKFLMVIALIHLGMAIILLISEFNPPEVKLASAAEAQENADKTTAELRRRESVYRMVRECVTALTRKTCDLPRHGGDAEQADGAAPLRQGAWCQQGFESGLQPIVNVIVANINTTLGVKSSRFTIEIHLDLFSLIGVEGIEDDNGYCLRYFHGSPDQKQQVGQLTNDAPVKWGAMWDIPNQLHIQQDQTVFHENGQPKQRLYFRRFATSPIMAACSESRIGVLVLTSMQDEPFAEDILDTLQFIASIVSNYVSAYNDCYSDHRRVAAVRSILQDVPPEKRESLALAFDILEECAEEPLPEWLEQFTVDGSDSAGELVVKGTRLLVEDLARLVEEGRSNEDLRRRHPELTEEHVDAVRQYAKASADRRREFGERAEDGAAPDRLLERNHRRGNSAGRRPSQQEG
jgi:uncharacterized protein (DUF433 family)